MEVQNINQNEDNGATQSSNYNNVCRTCFKEFETNHESYLNFSEVENLLYTTFKLNNKIKILDCDDVPDKICSDCNMAIQHSSEFLQKFQEVQNFLIKMKNLPEPTNSMDYADQSSVSTIDKDCQTDQTTIYCCEQCDQKFLDHAMLKSHRSVHGSDKFKCGRCDKIYTRLNYLQQHVAVSHPEYCNLNTKIVAFVNLCDICNKQFSRKDHLKTHLKNVHKQRIKVINPVVLDSKSTELEENSEHNSSSDESEDHFNDMDSDLDPSENLDVKIKEEMDNENDSDVEELDKNEEVNEIQSDDDDDEKPLFESLGKNDADSGDITIPKIEIKTESEDGKCDSSEKSGKSDKRSKSSKDKDKRHECETCRKTFTRATHLKRHILTHSDIKPFQCKICFKRFTRSDHLNLHMIHHSDTKPFECDVCKKGFVRMEHLKKHKDSQHNKDEDGNDLVKKEYCTICNKGFRTPKYLQIHMKSHSAEPKTLNCKYCDQEFQDKASLNQHSKDVHAQFEKPFLCSECGLRFVRNDYLVIHMRRHRGEKPYKCKYCGKGFPRATDLTVHERYHTNEKTHLCTTCGKGFQRAYNLLVHMRVHTGEKPYHCPHCIKSFAQGNDLKAHIRRHTGERYKCEICGDGFIQGYHLTHHKRTVHGLDVKSHIRRVEKFITPQSQEQQINAMKSGEGPVPPQMQQNLILSEVKLENFSMHQGNVMEIRQISSSQSLPEATETIPIENMMAIQFVQNPNEQN